ncbi:MAG: hypothetical protein FJW23_13635 [Acidimicrobiia bacterium]|nr:hypothetical protein [Acidimicrobiia bacterium]
MAPAPARPPDGSECGPRGPLAVAILGILAAHAAVTANVEVRGTALAAGRGQPNVVVWLEAASPAPPAADARPVMDQRNLRFLPQVLAVQVGSTVEFPNNDRVFHNVFSFRDGTRFDLGLYPIGASKLVRFDQPGVSRIFCNIHPQMAAYVVAVNSPYFAVSGADGSFVLPAVPEGTYTWRAWRAGRKDMAGTVRVQPGATLAVSWP